MSCMQAPTVYERQPMPMTQKDLEDFGTCKQKQDQQLREMIEFTQRHCELFPNLLRVAECPDSFLWKRKMTCPSDIIDELKLCLPPLRAPQTIDFRNWRQLVPKLKQTDLSCVEILDLLNIETLQAPAILWKNDPMFLTRCRALRQLYLITPGAGSFQWAVKERRAWDLHQAALTSLAPFNTWTSHSPKKPIPLEILSLVTNRYFKDELDDVVFAFGDTLQSAELYSDLQHRLADEQLAFSIGREWRLPKITKLMISMPNLRLLVDPDLYLHLGDKLRRLELLDKSTLPYEPQEVYTCQPFLESKTALVDIILQGWPALTFNPESLHRTPNLKILDLKMYRTQEMPQFYPSTEDLHASVFFTQPPQSSLHSTGAACTTEMASDSHAPVSLDQPRPLWTWDWHLPHLESLRLDNVFAILFQFQMLGSCPSLQRLELNPQSPGTTEGCQRVLSSRDFTLSGTSLLSSCSDSASSFVVAPSLKELYLHGGWILDDELRLKVFRVTFPGLVTLGEYLTTGCSAWGCVKALHFGIPNLKIARRYISRAASEGLEKSLEDHGLVRAPTQAIGFGFESDAQNLSEEKPATKTIYTLNDTAWHFADKVEQETEEQQGE